MAWAQLKAIMDEARVLGDEDRRRAAEPVDCPRCGSRLDVRNGVRNCPMGHWRSGGGA